MTRSNLSDNKSERIVIDSARFEVIRKVLDADYTIAPDSPLFYFLDPSGSNRIVTLPDFKRGRIHGVAHIGAGSDLIVKDTAGTTLLTIHNVEAAIFVCSGNEWKVFTNSVGDALDPTEVTSPDGSITVSVVGLAITVEVNEANVDHDALANFVANEHIDHTTVSVNTAVNSGLAGGGTIAASRSLTVDLNNLATTALALADYLPFYDVSGAISGKVLVSDLNALLVHNSLAGYDANRHIDHTAVSIQAGLGLSGGGTIDATRTLNLDFTELQTGEAIVGADSIPFYDASGADHNIRTVTEILADLNIVYTNGAGNPLVGGVNFSFANTGLRILDSNASNTLTLTTSSDLTADRTLTVVPGDASRTVTINGNPTLNDWFDQSVKVAATPQFASIELGHATDTTLARSAAGTVTVEGKQVLLASQTAQLSVGWTVSPNNLGNITSFTIDPALGNFQYGTNHGAATWTAPASDCAVDILVTNDATAGTITFSGFTIKSSPGDTLTTTNGHKFLIQIRRINAISTYAVYALQ